MRRAFEGLFSSPYVLALLVGTAIAAASLTLTGSLQVGTTIRIGGATGPTFSSGSGAPAATQPRGSIYLRTDVAGVFQNTDGATTWSQLGQVTPSVAAVDDGAYGASLNFSTFGNVDWFSSSVPGPSASYAPTGAPATATHHKLTGGYIAGTWRWRNVGSIFTGSGSTTFSSTASDSINSSSLSSTAVAGFQTSGGTSGHGFQFRVPARTTSLVLRIYIAFNGCDGGAATTTVTATLFQAGTTASVGITGSTRIAKITFNAAQAGDTLHVSALFAGTGLTGFCTFTVAGASLGTS